MVSSHALCEHRAAISPAAADAAGGSYCVAIRLRNGVCLQAHIPSPLTLRGFFLHHGNARLRATLERTLFYLTRLCCSPKPRTSRKQGEDWRLDELLKLLKPSDAKRRNYFNVLRAEVAGGIAWVSYWNRAVITNAEKSRAVVWLKSAVLRKQSGVWKRQMLHSTRLTTDKLPAGVILTEYVPAQ